ncbi:MAG: acetyl-CoA carboxylase biotin carboxyl carrier protein [Chloroflexi bacterium]|nr:MAG: acetyl-CoA carboxylase biotin carboxyl carrier protein [Chloroflexota bacterium]
MEEIKAPMAGTVLEILVALGDAVGKEDELLILESMKMEIPVEAPTAGTVATIAVSTGDPVQEDDLLLTLE